MIISVAKRAERAIDGLQKTYSVIIGLAIGSAIQALLKNPNGSGLNSWSDIVAGLPLFTAFLFTVVPFFHGMNRHLDKSYLERRIEVRQGALLFDIAVFLVEAGLLFAVTWSVRSVSGFLYLGAVLLIDVFWGLISHLIHYQSGTPSTLRRWSTINLLAIAAALFVGLYPSTYKPLLLMAIAILRTVADYGFCWKFYFPIGG